MSERESQLRTGMYFKKETSGHSRTAIPQSKNSLDVLTAEVKVVNLKTCEQEKKHTEEQREVWDMQNTDKEPKKCAVGIPEGKEVKNED